MSHIFVSYARSDQAIAEAASEALSRLGLEVWRDTELPAHRAYSDVIQERLESAAAVLVLWSEEAAKSQWVRAEADIARNKSKLIQATIDNSLPPLPFNQIQCANLSGWAGDTEFQGWKKVIESIQALGYHEISSPVVDKSRPKKGVSICVLPFQNMSGDPEQEYFSDGISEDITTDLSKVSSLSVVARNTAFTFKGQSIDVGKLARQLGITHVLEGSVRKAGNRVRITAQLIDGASGDHLWAERFDRELTDIFAIQDEISEAIVSALKLKLLPEERRAIEHRGTDNVEAYNLYLMARQQWMTGTHGETRREESVIRLCDRIISMEPSYSQAWALKSLALITLFYGYNVGCDDGEGCANCALELDPNLPEARSAKARIALNKRDFAEAERQIGMALEVAPESWEVNSEAARIYLWGHKYSEAIRYFLKCVDLVPEDLHAWEMLLMAHRAIGDELGERRAAEEMLKHAKTILVRDPQNHHAFARGANALVILRDLPTAQEWIERALLISPENLDLRYNFACALFAFPENRDLGLDYLEPVFARSVGSIVRRADLDSDLDPVRDDPRFKRMYGEALERIAKLDAAAVPD